MRPSEVVSRQSALIRQTIARFAVVNPRLFGSTAIGTDTETSDLDILVDTTPTTTLFDLGGLKDALEQGLGISVDVLTLEDLPVEWRQTVLDQSIPL